MGTRPLPRMPPIPDSISDRACAGLDSVRSPTSKSAPSTPMSRMFSVHELPAGDRSADRIIGGALAGPRRNDELTSYGRPTRHGDDAGVTPRVPPPTSLPRA